MRQTERLKKIVTIPIIASLNGHHTGSWIDFEGRPDPAAFERANYIRVLQSWKS